MKLTLSMSKRDIVLALLILMLVLLIILRPKSTTTYYRPVTLPTKNFVKNTSDKNYIDTLVHIGLQELGIENVSVEITPLTDEIRSKFDENIELKAAIIGNKYTFIMYVGDINRNEAIETVSHELIHLQQYHTEKLKVLDKHQLWWDGKIISHSIVASIPYEQREWETEAFNYQRILGEKIERILF